MDIIGSHLRTQEAVLLANLLSRNLAVLVLVGATRGIWEIIEQPLSSKKFWMWFWRRLMEALGFLRATTWMIFFGTGKPKPTQLVSNMPWASLNMLYRKFGSKYKAYIEDCKETCLQKLTVPASCLKFTRKFALKRSLASL